MARATSSLPVPLSPVISTGTSWAATRPMALYTSLHGRAGSRRWLRRRVVVRRRLGDDGRLAHQPGDLQRLADHAAQLVQVERLEQVVVGPLLHRLDGRVRRLGHGDEDDRDAGVDPADLPEDVQAGLVGQAQVEENDVRGLGGDALEALGPGVGDLDPVCRGGERLAHLLRDQGRVVVDEQQVGHDRAPIPVHRAGSSAGACPAFYPFVWTVGPTRVDGAGVQFAREPGAGSPIHGEGRSGPVRCLCTTTRRARLIAYGVAVLATGLSAAASAWPLMPARGRHGIRS